MEPSEERLRAAHRALADASRVRILEALRSSDAPLDVAALAARVGLHQNTVRSHLEILLKAGLVGASQERRPAPGRPRVVYSAAASQLEGGTIGGYHLLARILTSWMAGSAGRPDAAAVEAGRAWGRYLVERPAPFAARRAAGSVEGVARLLDTAGFEPEVVDDDGDHQIHLHRCPFRDLATEHPEITCSVHLGLIQGALEEMRAPVECRRLDRFVTPTLCVAHIEERTREGGPRSTQA